MFKIELTAKSIVTTSQVPILKDSLFRLRNFLVVAERRQIQGRTPLNPPIVQDTQKLSGLHKATINQPLNPNGDTITLSYSWTNLFMSKQASF